LKRKLKNNNNNQLIEDERRRHKKFKKIENSFTNKLKIKKK